METKKIRRRRSSVPHVDNDSSSSGEEDDKSPLNSPIRRSHATSKPMFSTFYHTESKRNVDDHQQGWTLKALFGIIILIALVVYLLQYFDATNRENKDRNPFYNS
jgi:hypothetical protein